jgi:hypothetical protein
LIEHHEKIIWDSFCSNEQPLAVVYLLEHPDKIDLSIFSWYNISKNPCIFVLDKEKMRATKTTLHQDLVKHFLHPDKITKWIATGQDVLDYPYFS